jgi:hypothetical protein
MRRTPHRSPRTRQPPYSPASAERPERARRAEDLLQFLLGFSSTSCPGRAGRSSASGIVSRTLRSSHTNAAQTPGVGALCSSPRLDRHPAALAHRGCTRCRLQLWTDQLQPVQPMQPLHFPNDYYYLQLQPLGRCELRSQCERPTCPRFPCGLRLWPLPDVSCSRGCSASFPEAENNLCRQGECRREAPNGAGAQRLSFREAEKPH